jgi:hypothetical protein
MLLFDHYLLLWCTFNVDGDSHSSVIYENWETSRCPLFYGVKQASLLARIRFILNSLFKDILERAFLMILWACEEFEERLYRLSLRAISEDCGGFKVLPGGWMDEFLIKCGIAEGCLKKCGASSYGSPRPSLQEGVWCLECWLLERS